MYNYGVGAKSGKDLAQAFPSGDFTRENTIAQKLHLLDHKL